MTTRVFGLDVLRALAIGSVLFSHAPYKHSSTIAVNLAHFFGYFGVELFFVLSGFLIGGILIRSLETRPSLDVVRNFWMRRWYRTLPTFLLFFVVNSLIGLWEDQAGDWRYLVFLQNFAWPHPTFFAEAWSLAVEEWFYFGLPLIVFAVVIRSRNVRLGFKIAIAAILFTVTLGRSLYVSLGHPDWDEAVRKVVIVRLDAVMFGVLGAFVKRWSAPFWLAARRSLCVLGIFGVGSAIFVFLHYSEADLVPRTLLLTLTSASALCLIPLCDSWEQGRVTLLTRCVTYVSLWSYSMYLCHIPLYKMLFGFRGGLLDWSRGGNLVSVALWTLATVGVAKLCYEYFEAKITALRPPEKIRVAG